MSKTVVIHMGKVAFQVPRAQAAIRKVAALGADLRMKGLGGVKRPAFPTEDSKNTAFKQLNNTARVGSFSGFTQPKQLVKPGPSIPQLATTPVKV